MNRETKFKKMQRIQNIEYNQRMRTLRIKKDSIAEFKVLQYCSDYFFEQNKRDYVKDKANCNKCYKYNGFCAFNVIPNAIGMEDLPKLEINSIWNEKN